ncbi:hypothetical protein AJ79_03378 [Helicocarpus griseus UAMH5409]|uniref:Starter acyltransferase (SAT) domain-containing protein n=1 Tax=Helicocarpus griseus UAMH5409 TaxID=1447875 RepID=A0A2B7XXQ4_9EURO|nr:hypothetical protein AJ79_03378 [Helicocarpus griseus UAMH5409]
MTRITNDGKKAAIFLFGSQVESLSKESLDEIRSTRLDYLSREWILDTVAGLPGYWDALAEKIPKITTDISGVRGRELLENLDAWLRGVATRNDTTTASSNSEQEDNQNQDDDDLIRMLKDLPSVALSPLVVLTQLAQYRRYLERNRQSGTTDMHASLVAAKQTSSLGFCMGMVAAFAVASASNAEQLDKYGSVAVRLAMLGGALIDAQDAANKQLGLGPSRSYVTAWHAAAQREQLQRIVDSLTPDAYVSVLYDEARATVTTSGRAASRLLRQLSAAVSRRPRSASVATSTAPSRKHAPPQRK